MKRVFLSLLVRNGTVILLFLALLTGNRLVRHVPVPWVESTLIVGGFLCALLWANAPLLKRGHPVMYALLSLLLVPGLFPIAIVSLTLARPLIEWQYRAEGFQLVAGCNGGAANGAVGQVRKLEELIQLCADTPGGDPSRVVELQSALSVAREKARVLNEDCDRRFHCETVPWKAEWAAVDMAMKDAEVP